jgi:ABC-type nitrate/sulfonate/bicarbonate transport system substrate-binding protein
MLTRRQFKKVFVGSCFTAFVSTSLMSCSNPGDGASPEVLTVRLAQNLSPISGVAIVAKEQGFFDEYNLDVQVSNFTSGKQALETVIGGGADIATTAEAPTTAAAMANQPIAFLARMEYSDLKTLATAESGIETLSDLAGKRIGFTAGTGGEVYTMTLLKEAGLTPDDVNLVNLRPQEMLPALTAGSIDAYNTWEPHISKGIQTLGDQVKQLDTSGIYAETFNIVTIIEYLDENPEVIDRFLRALIDAEQWMAENREEAITVVAETVGMDQDELALIWDDYIYEVVLDQRTMDVLKAHAEWRLESGNHPDGATMPDFTEVIFAEPLKSIDPTRVKVPGL